MQSSALPTGATTTTTSCEATLHLPATTLKPGLPLGAFFMASPRQLNDNCAGSPTPAEQAVLKLRLILNQYSSPLPISRYQGRGAHSLTPTRIATAAFVETQLRISVSAIKFSRCPAFLRQVNKASA